MSTNTRTRTQKFTPAPAQFEAGLVWVDDQPTWPTTQAPTRTPAQIKTHVATVRAAMIAETTPAPAADLSAEMFTRSGADLRKLAYTPTGRTRTTPEAQAALGEIARRAARKAARKAAR